MKNLWHKYLDTPLIWKITAGLVLGVFAGFMFGEQASVISPLGDVFLNLLMALIIPLLILTLIVGINEGPAEGLGRMGSKMIGYYFVTSAFALSIGLAVALIIRPGQGLTLPGDADVDVPQAPGFLDFIVDIFPANIIETMLELDILSMIFIAIVVGLAIAALRKSGNEQHEKWGEQLVELSRAGSEVSFKIMNWILQYAPIGIFAIVASTIGEQGWNTLTSLGSLVGTVYVSILLQFIVYIVILKLIGRSPIRFFKAARDATATAFTTQSSLGTLPITMRAAKKLNLREKLYGFSLPLGATMNMDGAAIRVGASVIFAANIIGQELSLWALIGIVLAGTLASVGTAGVPGAGLITLSVVLTQAGLPIEVVALVASVDALLGMAATACNVTGDLVGTSVVDKTEEAREAKRK
ncbi:dicarboxylate/amino acid:cation symporter [Alteribacter aurantiacus]|uniref:dicarboxylate/amino acid:cation symporter n=1 Tax=Alteribacter aurantiacus TaxID=254410 RepID=UPI00040F0A31|nr:dicarboxylate/amino acid:cation symporter [Alteribacter aurantiacus]